MAERPVHARDTEVRFLRWLRWLWCSGSIGGCEPPGPGSVPGDHPRAGCSSARQAARKAVASAVGVRISPRPLCFHGPADRTPVSETGGRRFESSWKRARHGSRRCSRCGRPGMAGSRASRRRPVIGGPEGAGSSPAPSRQADLGQLSRRASGVYPGCRIPHPPGRHPPTPPTSARPGGEPKQVMSWRATRSRRSA